MVCAGVAGPVTKQLRTRPLRDLSGPQASPPALCPHGRTRDLDALLAVMGAAQEFLYASVMEYFPTTRFRHPARWASWGLGCRLLTCGDPLGAGRQGPAGPRTLTLPCPSPRYWPVLDTALRVAAFSRGVRVRLLVSCWLNTDPRMFPFLRSLQALSNPAANVSLDVVRTRPWAGWGSGLSAP